MKKIAAFVLCLFAGAAALFAQNQLVTSKTWQAAEVSSLSFRLSYEDLKVERHSGNEVKIAVYSNNASRIPEISLSGGTLLVKNRKKQKLHDRCRLVVQLPRDYRAESFSAESSSGGMSMEELSAGTWQLSASSGTITCGGITADTNFAARTSSGNITLDTIRAKTITCGSNSGSIRLLQLTAESISCRASSGDMRLSQAEAKTLGCTTTSGSIGVLQTGAERLSCTASSGNIAAECTGCRHFAIHAKSGRVQLELDKAPAEASEIKTSSGDIQLRMPKASSFELALTSSSGDFNDEFNRNTISARNTFRSTYNGGGVQIKLESSSGNIRLSE